MNRFSTAKQAKDYLAGRIVAEAKRAGIPLSEIELKVLYFSETDWTLPNMAQVSEEFDRDYDQDEYEQKITGLVREMVSRGHPQNQVDTEEWDAAVEKLSNEDHYLSVLVRTAGASTPGFHSFLPRLDWVPTRPPHDRLKLWATASAIVFGFVMLLVLGNWLFGARFWTVMDWIMDRNHSGLLLLSVLVVWLAWTNRGDLKMVVKGFLGRK